MIKTVISIIIVFSISVALIFYYFANGLAEGLCSNEIYKEYPSPNQSLKAVVFQRECGPSSGATTQVSVINAAKNLENRAGNVLVIKGHPKTVAPKLEWNSEQEMIIYHQIDGSEFKAETRLELDKLVKIEYKNEN